MGGRIRSLPSRPDPGLLSEREAAADQPLTIALLLVCPDLAQHDPFPQRLSTR